MNFGVFSLPLSLVLVISALGTGCHPSRDTETLNGVMTRSDGRVWTGYGVLPTTVTIEQARAAYEDFKEAHLEDCGDGIWRVRWENERLDATVSEGIGYGMLLSVIYGERKIFDGLWNYYQQALDANGLMHWLRHGCQATRETTYSEYPDNAASDADLDAALALIMANCRWGDASYSAAAHGLLEAIRSHETAPEQERFVLLPGDDSWFKTMGGGCFNPSYASPGHLRAFANFVTNPADKAFWSKMADDTYTILSSGQDPKTGLVKNWTTTSGGTADCADVFRCPENFGDDAARTPWRVAIDYAWHGTADAQVFLNKMTRWVEKDVGIDNLGANYTLTGEVGTCVPQGGRIITVGAMACAAMAADQETVDEFAAEMKNITDPDYFEKVLRALYLALLSGQFNSCGNAP